MKLRSEKLRATKLLLAVSHVGITKDLSPGDPDKYLLHLEKVFKDAARKGVKLLLLVLYGRVSSGKQGREGNLTHQLPYVRRRIEKLSKRYMVAVDIIDESEFGEEVSGWKLWKNERSELVKAAKLAKEKRAILVALNTSRFVRNKRYQRARTTLPTVDDFEQLIGVVGGVKLATILPPNVQEDHSSDTKRGFKARGAKPGRPWIKRPGDKDRRRVSFKIPIIRLFKQGCRNCEVMRQLGLPEKTVRNWRIRYRRYWDASFSRK
jgi:DNA invertase Pin-like site-specific DNA recombinase